ncbi:MAG: PGF-CTERM protein [Natronomonas sp.]|jgi:PGF-CTERM protein
MRFKATALALLMTVSMVSMAAAPVAATQQEGETYSGANIEFETTGNAVADYAVDGNVIVENVTVQSASEADSGVDAGLESTTAIDAAGLEIDSQARAGATIRSESGAEMETHDNQRGIVQIRADSESQVVNVNVSGEAESESDERVVVTKDDGSQGTFIVVGDGEVVVNEDGEVNAEIEQGSELVYRQYDGERSDDDEETERMIQNGTATAEVYVQQSQDGGEQTVADAVEYGEDTSVEIKSASENQINMTVERSQSQGKVILTTVSDSAFENTEDLTVTVDGEAAAQADSYSAVRQSAAEGDEPRYYVSQSSSAEGSVDVAIGIDHFSTRNVAMSSDGSDDGGDGGMTDDDGAGFGPIVALLAVVGSLLAARRHA